MHLTQPRKQGEAVHPTLVFHLLDYGIGCSTPFSLGAPISHIWLCLFGDCSCNVYAMNVALLDVVC